MNKNQPKMNFNVIKLLFIGLFVLINLISSPAQADTTMFGVPTLTPGQQTNFGVPVPPPPPGPQSKVVEGVYFPSDLFFTNLNAILGGFISSAGSLASAFTTPESSLGGFSYATTLSIFLFAIIVSWEILMMMLGEDGSKTISTILKTLLIWGIVNALIYNWAPTALGSQSNSNFTCTVLSFQGSVINRLASGIESNQSQNSVMRSGVSQPSQGACGVSNQTDIVSHVLSAYITAAANVISVAFPSEPKKDTWTDRTFNIEKQKIVSYSDGSIFGDIYNSLLYVAIAALELIICLIAAAYIIYTMVKYIFVVLTGTAYMAVAFALGPILLPFVMAKQSAFLFKGFLKLLISGMLYSIVAVILTGLTLPILGQLVDSMSGTNNAMGMDAVYGSLLILIFCFLINMLMARADNISSTLSEGGPNIGHDMGQGFIQSVGNRVSNGVSSAASGAAKMVSGSSGKKSDGSGGSSKPSSSPSGGGGAPGAAAKVVSNVSAASGIPILSSMSNISGKLKTARMKNRGY